MDKRLRFKTRLEYHNWLQKNCSTNEPIWIEFYKDGTKGITYDDAIEESLCFGWIDSLIKKVDEKIYVRKFCRRRSNSKWSETNRKKAEELIEQELMTRHGLKTILEAKSNGQWEKGDEREEIINVSGLRSVLKNKLRSLTEFDRLSESLKKHYSLFYFSAKKEETRNKRIELIMEYMKTKKRFM
ncbi:MAG TPA: YdeI/OmpD-associated family protein [Candidatus Acidoferrales bacterium]|nr:YdeI/OmpD-associated family protein [Candidatus Acidoferrales bacterium]